MSERIPDLLNRRYTAEKMIQMFALQQEGFVVAVDAPWGDGKTHFARIFIEMLEKDYNAAPVFINAFEHDYANDPFMVLASAVYAKIKEDEKFGEKAKNFLSSAKNIGKTFLPVTAQLLLRGITGGLINGNIADEIKNAIGEGGAKITETFLEEQLTSYKEDQNNVLDFKKALAEFAKSHWERTTNKEDFPKNLPLIIFVDELDRCNPAFAVRLLERIKHFFDTENVVFVLLVNKRQIFEAIRGTYGSGVKAEHYLEKFINYSFTLNGTNYQKNSRPTLDYCEQYMVLKDTNTDPRRNKFVQKARNMMCYIVSKNVEISLRDIEKIADYVFRCDNSSVWDFGDWWAFFATLKAKYPLGYIAFVEKDYDGMCEIVGRLLPDPLNEINFNKKMLISINRYCSKELTPEQQDFLKRLTPDSLDSDIIQFLTNRMDFK